MDKAAAVPKGNRAPDAESTREPMRAGVRRGNEVRRSPSTDEKKAKRLQSKGTVNPGVWAERLSPGDQIQLPNGKTQQVLRVRRHETSSNHVYVDTDGGTVPVERRQPFTVVPHNSQQQSSPGYGVPGANSNAHPFSGHGGPGGSNQANSTQCPNCRGNGTLARKGDHYACSRCGYVERFGGAGGLAFSDQKSQVTNLPRSTQPRVNSFATVNGPLTSAIARRAREVLEQEESS